MDMMYMPGRGESSCPWSTDGQAPCPEMLPDPTRMHAYVSMQAYSVWGLQFEVWDQGL